MPTDNLTDILFVHWQHTLQPFGVDQISTENAFNHLVAAYSTANRYYHTLKHIHHVLNTIKTLQAYTKDLTAVQLAAWFHDIIYNSQSKNNEAKSAEYAAELLIDLGVPPHNIAVVTRLILNTKHHQAEIDDVDSQVLLDADLAILSANPIQYWEYANAIRQEYAWLGEAEYVKGRSQVLARFLQCDRIYSTPLMFHLAEQSARHNINTEIELK
jgi:predicted metal-dependent HD superfamily phosphohydrolase